MSKKPAPVEPTRVYETWGRCYLTKISDGVWEMPPGFAQKYHALANQQSALQTMLNGVAAFVATQQQEIEAQKRACWDALREAVGASPDAQMSLQDGLRKLHIHSSEPDKPAKLVIKEPDRERA